MKEAKRESRWPLKRKEKEMILRIQCDISWMLIFVVLVTMMMMMMMASMELAIVVRSMLLISTFFFPIGGTRK